jgi:hypothetical protein
LAAFVEGAYAAVCGGGVEVELGQQPKESEMEREIKRDNIMWCYLLQG